MRAADGEEGNAPGDAIEQRVRLPPAVMARARIGSYHPSLGKVRVETARAEASRPPNSGPRFGKSARFQYIY